MSYFDLDDLFYEDELRLKEERRKRKRLTERKRDKKRRERKDPKFMAMRVKASRRNYMKRMYGLTPGGFKELCIIQNNKCAICCKSEKLHIDHCHKVKKLRGLLCGKCNKGLGLFDDSTINLEAAIEYLQKFNRSQGIMPSVEHTEDATATLF